MIFDVAPGIYRGPRPDMKAFEELRKLRVRAVLNVEGGLIEAITREANLELGFCMGHRMHALFMDLNAIMPPSPDQVWLALKILGDKFYHPIYVHCKAGVDRTGFIIACYRMLVQGWPYDKAVDEMLRFGFHLPIYFWWLGALKRISVDGIRSTEAL